MAIIELHPRTLNRNIGSSTTAERRFLDTPDITEADGEVLPELGSPHPEFFSLVCTGLTETTGHNKDPQQKQITARYEERF